MEIDQFENVEKLEFWKDKEMFINEESEKNLFKYYKLIKEKNNEETKSKITTKNE